MGIVRGCRCSAATTEGTAAWRAGLVTATLQAADLPLPGAMEDHLRALAAGEDVEDVHGFAMALLLRQFVRPVGEGELTVTDLARAYLAARDGERTRVRARVSTLDGVAATARVLLDVDRPDPSVTVLLDQLLQATGGDVLTLPGTELEVTANLDAERTEDIVLTDIRAVPVPLPDAWRKQPAEPEAPETEQGDDGD
ncbi:hypothetical protein [Streptomyces fuscigenes]|uniref:hypothetical protein n=1 Tax=Streptomyces fuscigenes TaxID=1528880 RepID=UPI001F272FA2|nr:hypothetical protein [Streptomyces fuscigenes]MCF3960333.1 hypothetical protein [Streptomyces fuscigenes]